MGIYNLHYYVAAVFTRLFKLIEYDALGVCQLGQNST